MKRPFFLGIFSMNPEKIRIRHKRERTQIDPFIGILDSKRRRRKSKKANVFIQLVIDRNPNY